ncbi:hypothetical protein DRB17_12645 [Ferruginivarius sediminum]|uniref:L,D-TPase catalytic domain-containing protein n=2 Tax=Ferruginivarius sediminum TaxID=2661937 RepID=A0A369TAQ2_9PROT|nr:hypothetical protein DRB17_12645 [Ferruginivarius sediminum]
MWTRTRQTALPALLFAGLAACTADPYLEPLPRDDAGNAEASASQSAGQGTDQAEARKALLPRLADKVIVDKGRRQLHLVDDGQVFLTFKVALGSKPSGPKRAEGDGRTPEGSYVLDWRNPDSRFYRSIHISYPSPGDIRRARREGVDPGDNIMIHGLPADFEWMGRSHALTDWTEGCIAVTNEEMDLIWKSVPPGTPIEIRP